MWFDFFLFFFYYPLFSSILAAIQDIWCIQISIQSTLFWCFRLWFGDWWLFLALNWLIAFCLSHLYDLLCPRLQLHLYTLLFLSYLFNWFALRRGWQLNKFYSVRTRWLYLFLWRWHYSNVLKVHCIGPLWFFWEYLRRCCDSLLLMGFHLC